MSATLDERLRALAEAARLAEGRLDGGGVEAARAVVARAGERLGLGLEATVVALAGPTGAGKSSLFNALAGAELAAVGARRPTTDATVAAAWGDAGGPLLDWLAVPRRHLLAPETGLDGLVLLDLPDFDSVAAAHRVEADRVVALADVLLWVVDPQKYADARWHEGYLRRLEGHGGAMVVALNQADRLGPDALAACAADLGRLLAAEGLDGVPVLAVSARTGEGLDDLRVLVRERVAARSAALARLSADAAAAAAPLLASCGPEAPSGVGRAERERLVSALAGAAGVPTVVAAVERSHRRRGALATGWPFVRWLRRLRPDALRRLRLGEARADVHTSLPGPSPVQRADVSAALRALGTSAGDGLPEPWPRAVRSAATSSEDALAGRLDRAVAGADLHVRPPRWWRVANALQLAVAAAVAAGALWLLALALLAFVRLDDVVPVPEARGVPLPTLLLLAGALAGAALSLLAGALNRAAARRRARAAGRGLRAAVGAVADELVVAPVEAELEAYGRLCELARTAGGDAAGGRRRLRGSPTSGRAGLP